MENVGTNGQEVSFGGVEAAEMSEMSETVEKIEADLKSIGFVNTDTIKKQIKKIVSKQNDFQIKAMKQDDWWNVLNKSGKPVNYMIANIAELGEAVDSVDYKWWGKPEIDNLENFIVEGIDALHFCISYHLHITCGNLEVLDEPMEFAALAVDASNLDTAKFGENRREALYDALIHFNGYSSLVYMNMVSMESVEDQTEEWKQNILELIYNTYKNLFAMLYLAGVIDFDEIERRYMVKNALNNVRKMNGYENGTYVKTWLSPVGLEYEDNVVALNVIHNAGITDFDEIVTALDTYYKENAGI